MKERKKEGKKRGTGDAGVSCREANGSFLLGNSPLRHTGLGCLSPCPFPFLEFHMAFSVNQNSLPPQTWTSSDGVCTCELCKSFIPYRVKIMSYLHILPFHVHTHTWWVKRYCLVLQLSATPKLSHTSQPYSPKFRCEGSMVSGQHMSFVWL